MIRKIDNYFEEILLVSLLVLMSIILGFQIILRYFFHYSLSWSEELVRYMFIYSCFLGVPYCIKNNISIKVDVFKNIIPIKFQKILFYVEHIIILVLFLILSKFSFDVVYSSFISMRTSPAMKLPIWIMQSCFFIGSFLSVIRTSQNIYKKIKSEEI